MEEFQEGCTQVDSNEFNTEKRMKRFCHAGSRRKKNALQLSIEGPHILVKLFGFKVENIYRTM